MLDMLIAHKYSGAINAINGTKPNEEAITNLKTVYNIRNIAISSTSIIGGNVNYEYYGTVKGKYINYDNVRNEGSFSLTLNKNIGTSGTTAINII